MSNSMNQGAFQGAGQGRRLKNLFSSSSGPNRAIRFNLNTLRNRIRDFSRNEPWVRKAVKSYKANLVGTGIRPICNAPDKDFNAEAQNLWDDFADDCDITGRMNFYALQGLTVVSMMTSGEAFFQKIYVDPTEENPIPFRLKAIESDLLDHTYSVSKLTNGNRIVSGVELDENDRPVSYHFFAQHPGEDASIVQERVEIPADRIYHIFDAERPGQVRGYPQAAAAITRILGLSDYEGAELDRKKLSAMLFAFVTAQLPDAEGEHVFGGKNSSDGVFEADLEPGTAQYLEPGEDIKFNEPADVGGSYEAFMKMNLRAVAACFDVSYEQMTGDLTSVNFSSIRAGLNEMQRIYRQTQALVIIPQLCRRVWRDFAREAITNFLIPAPDFTTNPRGYLKAKWIAPGWPYVNPLQEAQANIAEVRAGLNSRENVVGSKGFDINELDTQIATDNDRADTLGLKFDSDARTTNKSGAVQPDVETNT